MKGFRFLVDAKAVRISESYALRKSIFQDEAIRIFFGSYTYHILNDDTTGLYLEVFESVYNMFLEERGEQAHET
jgi:hypothetical protein